MLSKQAQTQKTKPKNQKKMSRAEKKNFCEWILSECGGMCQISGCDNPAQDFAHAARAYKRDDREAAMICRFHHQMADQPTPKQVESGESVVVNAKLREAARMNMTGYEEHIGGYT